MIEKKFQVIIFIWIKQILLEIPLKKLSFCCLLLVLNVLKYSPTTTALRDPSWFYVKKIYGLSSCACLTK